MSKFQFSNVVVVNKDQIGVIVKSWEDGTHDVYVRSCNRIISYQEKYIRHYIFSKELLPKQREFYEK